ncbi:MAG: hydroxymethylbilane synthase [Clostridiales bacterium]|nr:hydroxymethylbilane synthase [Clostridiales bacterium]MCF8021927.1 hydroxymethylbilane synthase [Clostridiales bacterium]
MHNNIVIGTRKSELAMQQTRYVYEHLQKLNPEYSFEIKGMKTTGDNILDVALAKIGDKNLFTKELELALENEELDLVVHSMKDLSTELPEGLTISAVTEREFPGDVLIAPEGTTIDNLPNGASIGTSSLRRQAQLLRYRPDLKIVTIRGNIHTRIRKQSEQNLDGIILAHAGVYRMGMENTIAQKIPYSICLPAVGQGALGIETRENNPFINNIVRKLNHYESSCAIKAERALLKTLEGGCQAPIGTLGQVSDKNLYLQALVASLDGKDNVYQDLEGHVDKANNLGKELAYKLLASGAKEILDKVKQETDNHEQ